jgi:hypothetical protein
MCDYSKYIHFIGEVCDSGNLQGFKNNYHYQGILEHVSRDQGTQYLKCIRENTNISLDEILSFCNLNDRVGNPHLHNHNGIYCSPTSLRYIWHAHLILAYFSSLSNRSPLDVIEIGGGYGGLCLAVHHFSKKYNVEIKSYTIVDLEAPLRLQKLYLAQNPVHFDVRFVNANTYGADINTNGMYLISNYCFSEIDSAFQQKYIQHLFPKVAHGFMVWNHIPVYNFGFSYREEVEVPNTAATNKYVYF